MSFSDAIRIGAAGSADTAYTINRSLRFNGPDDVTYLQRTYGSAGNRRTFTLSVWMKRPKLGRNNDLWTPYRGGDGGNESRIQIQSDDQMRIYDSGGASGYPVVRTKARLRDTSAWYHLVYAIDTTQATDSNRVKLYINGVHQEVDTSGFHQWPNQNIELGFNNNHYHRIGAYGQNANAGDATGNLSSEYLAEFYVIDGQQLTPSTFAETNADTGQWNPKNSDDVKAAVTFGTNGFYLNFSDNSAVTATTLGKDYSGNGNNWTPYNFSVSAGVGNDSLTDTPTKNFAILNELDLGTSNVTLKNGGLDFTSSGAGGARSTIGMSSGKWYAEVTLGNSTGTVGITKAGSAISSFLGNSAGEYSYGQNGYKIDSSAQVSYGDTFTTGDVISVAFDADGGNLYFYKNGTIQASGTAAFTSLTDGPYFFAFGNNVATTACSFNFGQRPFSYTIPTGYKALNTNNLPEPTILLPNQHFDILNWTGNGSSRNITGLQFDPDWVWIKNRTTAYDGDIYDTVRGNNNRLFSGDTPHAENLTNIISGGQAGSLSFNVTGGFSITGSAALNGSSDEIVAWNWYGGGSTVTNDDGSIDSQVRANTTAGFSIVTYTGTGSDETVGHGLGVAPDLLIVKNRTDPDQWGVYFRILGTDGILQFSVVNTQWSGGFGTFNYQHPTSSVFEIDGASGMSGLNNENFVAYLFSEVAGYSKFGKYKGNGDSDGPFVYTGFKPAYVVTKGATFASNWNIFDNKRNPHNVTNKILFTNLNSVEATGSSSDNQVDFLSNGFKLRGSNVDTNSSGNTFTYIAFA